MTPDDFVNLSLVGPDIHPCFKVDHFANTIRNTPSAMCVLLCIFQSLLSFITVCGNLLVIISIIYFKQLHTPTNFLIVSLAVADLLVGIIVCPFSIAFPNIRCVYFYYWSPFCMARRESSILLSTSSLLILGCISIDRYYAVCHPLTYRTKMSRHVVAIMILVSWGFPVLQLIGIIRASYFPCYDACSYFYAIMIIFIGYLPLIIMISIFCIYLKIFLAAQRQVRSIQNTTCQSTKSGATVSKMERKATKTLAIVLGVFVLSWLPYFLVALINSANLTEHNPELIISIHVNDTLAWIKLLNSMLNPFIYAFFYSWFRSAIRMIISGKIFQGDFTNSQLH